MFLGITPFLQSNYITTLSKPQKVNFSLQNHFGLYPQDTFTLQKKEFNEVEVETDCLVIPEISEVETIDGWKYGKDLKLGDIIITSEGNSLINNIEYRNKQYFIYI